jgi:hypothetical protein
VAGASCKEAAAVWASDNEVTTAMFVVAVWEKKDLGMIWKTEEGVANFQTRLYSLIKQRI